tara:strand:- start:1712 stop:4270 length:2559 start_codon:yes stop_codon:yes gene_type:complete
MAVSAGMALLSTGVGAVTGNLAFGTLLFAGGGVATLGTMMASHFLVSTALGAALNALTPKPSTGGNRGYQVTQNGSALDHQIIYGKVKVGGARVFDSTTGSKNKFLHRVLAFTGHEIESFDEIYINDDLVTLDGSGNVTSPSRYDGKVRINKHLGASDQTVDTDLSSEVDEWTSNHRLRGISYLYVRLKYDADAFPNGVPEITATIKGKKVKDPRDGSTAWSDNPALCMRDYLTSTTYGLGEDESNVDDTKVISAANVCDQANTPDGSTRYTCNGAFTTASTPYDTLSNLLTSMGGLLWYAQGQWRMKPAYWTEPTLTLDENDLRSSFTVNTRHSRRDNYNTVKGTFRGSESNWQVTDYPEVSNQAFLSADNQQESSIDLALPFTDTSVESRRIANVSLERNRQQLTISGSFGMRAFQLQVGDNIKINNTRFGFVNKEFEVTSWTFGLVDGNDLQVQMILREVSESVFDDVSDGVVYERDNTNLLSPFDVPSLGINAVAVAQVLSEKLVNTLVITTTATESERIDLVEVQLKPTADTEYVAVGTGELGVFSSIDLERGDYDVRSRAINTFGVKGDWEYLTDFTVDALSDPPSDVTGFDKQLTGGSVFFSWDAVPDLDLSYYEIKYSAAAALDVTWTRATTVISKVARPATTASLPARSGTFLIKAYDKGGNPSVNFTSLVVSNSELSPLTSSGSPQTATEDPSFSGTNTNTSLSSGELIITDQSAAKPTGTYEFLNEIDTGAINFCRVTGFPVFTRVSPTAGLWDDIPQNWDSWGGNWDDWTGSEANFADVGVEVYVASTPDDPSGSPAWSSWVLANGSMLSGRAFKFKAVLNSQNTNVSPSVSTLSATVEY